MARPEKSKIDLAKSEKYKLLSIPVITKNAMIMTKIVRVSFWCQNLPAQLELFLKI
jgi:hypothetical protein